MPAARILVTGLVQGVFFRAQAKDKADQLGLKGWVRNNNDGTVEMVAEGSADSLKQLEEWSWEGPPKAKVQYVTVIPELEHGYEEFELQP